MPPTTTSPETDQPTWSRFSKWDALVLALCISAVTLYSAWAYLWHPQRASEMRLWEVPIISIAWGLSLAGPFVLLEQYLRGRRIGPRLGEWLWVTPCLLLLVYLLGGRGVSHLFRDPVIRLLWSYAILFLQETASFIALFVMFQHQQTWSERLGSLSCLLFGTGLILTLIFNPPRI